MFSINEDIKKAPFGAFSDETIRELTDIFQTVHVRTQYFRYFNTAICLLVVFQHRNQRTPYRQARAVEGMDQTGFLIGLLRQRACMRRAWKSQTFEHEEISR